MRTRPSRAVTDVWFCPSCHSLNRQRDQRCYKCKTPQDAAGSAGPDVRVEAAIVNRTVTRYRSTRLLAIAAIGLILTVAAIGLAITVAGFADLEWLRGQLAVLVTGGTLDQRELAVRTERLAGLTTLRLGLAVGALILFAAWLARVIANIPALGGGVPSRSPVRAFIYTLIPVWNLIKVPGMIQDALYRVEPRAGGFFMVAVAWFGLVGSWFVSFIGEQAIAIRFADDLIGSTSSGQRVAYAHGLADQLFGLDLVTSLLVAGGGVVLVMLMVRIERRSIARDREIQSALRARGFLPVKRDPLRAPAE